MNDRQSVRWFQELFEEACQEAGSVEEALSAANYVFSVCPTPAHRDVLKIFNKGLRKLQKKTARSVPLSLSGMYAENVGDLRRPKPH
jgi:hypothetical protein